MRYADLKAEMGEHEVAERHWLCSLAKKPNLNQARLNLARHLVHLGKRGPAEQQLRTLTTLDPNNLSAHVLMSQSLEARGALVEAGIWMERAAQTAGGVASLYRRSARIYEAGGRSSDALRVRTIADKLDPPVEKRSMRPLRKRRRKTP
jgi:predicted Zn-dependent protease